MLNSLRSRLIILLALALLPASTLAIMQALANYEQVKGLTERSLLQSSAIVATEEKNEIVAARDALEGLAELGEVLSFVPHDRSEERRVGTECVSTCRSRWSLYP